MLGVGFVSEKSFYDAVRLTKLPSDIWARNSARPGAISCPVPVRYPKAYCDPEMELDYPKRHGGNHVGRVVGYVR